uniref:Protein FAM33A n=1 Tax=Oryzias latipes TaxID=8090 RepID=A0A3P9I1I6_ORYLA
MEFLVDRKNRQDHFQKSEADLDYIERRLKLDFINSTAENGSPAENPAVMLENLKAVKAKYSLLCSEVKDIANAQKESMEAIRTSLSGIMEVIKHCQETSDAEVPTLQTALWHDLGNHPFNELLQSFLTNSAFVLICSEHQIRKR